MFRKVQQNNVCFVKEIGRQMLFENGQEKVSRYTDFKSDALPKFQFKKF